MCDDPAPSPDACHPHREELTMTPCRRLLTIAALVAIAGCQESQSGDSASSPAGSQSTTSGATGGTSASSGSSVGATATTPTPTPGTEITTASGLKIQEQVVGTGAEAVQGKTVSVHYTGWLTDGTQFDSSRDSGRPIEFPLGTPGIVQGWNEGIAGMKVGGKRRLTIPPALGYGAAGRPPVIPPNATMVFEVELVGVR
jgi:FKBP-type peptidyl-prolyl cis-trans isomerase